MQETMSTLAASWPVAEYLALNFVVTVIILIVGWTASGFAARAVKRMASRSPRIDPTIIPMMSTVTLWSIRIFVLIAVLSRFGVQTASVIAVLGAAGLAIGLALQGTLQNIAAGIMLLALRPLRAGEYISVVGKGDGTVAEVGLFLTRLIQFDGVHLTLPNSLVWGNPIINYSRNATRRLDVEVGVRLGDDLDLAMRELQALIDNHEYVLRDPPPRVMATEYRESTTILNLRVWVASANYWDLRFDLYRNALRVLERAGLRIPVPVRELHSPPAEEKNAAPQHQKTAEMPAKESDNLKDEQADKGQNAPVA
jgi:small-conductance mechanosensitive channel